MNREDVDLEADAKLEAPTEEVVRSAALAVPSQL